MENTHLISIHPSIQQVYHNLLNKNKMQNENYRFFV